VRIGPPLDLVEFLDADRHAAERLVDIGPGGSCFRLLAVQVGEGVEVAGFDGVVARLELFERRALTATECVDE
jgi:hypothetical protein